MKKLVQYIFFAVVLISFAACSDDPKDNTPEWASVEAYEDFFLSEYEPSMLTRTLVIETNDDAKHKVSSAMKLALVDNDGKRVGLDKAQLFKANVATEDNVLVVMPGDTEVEVGIKLNKSFAQSGDKTCYWGFKVIENPGYELICDLSVSELSALNNQLDSPNQVIKITIEEVANDVKVWTMTGLWIVAGILFAIFLICRMNNPRVHFTEIKVDYGYGPIKTKTRGCYKVVFTNKSHKEGLLSRIFVGKVAVVRDEFWTEPVQLKCQFFDKSGLFLMTGGDYILPDFPKRKDPFEIKKDKNNKVTIETN